jgi:hypothetical protein
MTWPTLKTSVQQFVYCCVCIRYRGNVSTEPLPSNDTGIITEPLPSNDRGIFTELSPCNGKGTFTEPLPSNDRGIHRHTRTQRDLISLFLFFQNKESRLKNEKQPFWFWCIWYLTRSVRENACCHLWTVNTKLSLFLLLRTRCRTFGRHKWYKLKEFKEI